MSWEAESGPVGGGVEYLGPRVLVSAAFSISSEIERLSAGCGGHRALVKHIDKSIIGSFYCAVTAHTAPMLRAIAGAHV
ncbi:hypothetical protein C8J44_0898 [Sphingomonas sp. PP-CE-3A-406]|nr:hypothetical protein C8J44_0898 [Sphingomonas sp. PP-CE-3A-406]